MTCGEMNLEYLKRQGDLMFLHQNRRRQVKHCWLSAIFSIVSSFSMTFSVQSILFTLLCRPCGILQPISGVHSIWGRDQVWPDDIRWRSSKVHSKEVTVRPYIATHICRHIKLFLPKLLTYLSTNVLLLALISHFSLRSVPAYYNAVKESWDRCLDIYMCPRVHRKRVSLTSIQIIGPYLPCLHSSTSIQICNTKSCLCVVFSLMSIPMFWNPFCQIQRSSNLILLYVSLSLRVTRELLFPCQLILLANGLLQVWVSLQWL